MRNLIVVAVAALWIVGCASTSTSTSTSTTSSANVAPAPKPTYNEKVAAVNLDEFKPANTCPESKWESPDWKRVVSYASACVRSGDWKRVEMLGNHLAIHAPLTPWGAYYMSLAATARKDYPRAQWMLELALKKAPAEGLLHYQLGRLHWELGDERAALNELKQASELNPSLIDAHYVMGTMALQKEDYSTAEKLLRKALAVDSRHFPSLMAMASMRMKRADWSQAESALEDAIRVNSKSSKARLALAEVQEQHLKKLVEALQTYKEIRGLVQQRKLDEVINVNLDEKIKTLEKSTQAVSGDKVSARQPTAEGQVAK